MIDDAETRNRETIAEAKLVCFEVAAELLQEAGWPIVENLRTLPENDRRLTEVTVLMILVAAFRRLRSITVLCEMGHMEDANILLRSLFELVLAGLFVLDDDPSAGGGIEIPSGEDPQHFRAMLYTSWRVLKVATLNPDSQSARDAADQIRARLPEAAIERLKRHPKTFSGLNARQMAKRYGAEKFYEIAYSLQSDVVHGLAGSHLLDFESEGGIGFDFAVSLHDVRVTMEFASTLVCQLLKRANQMMSLGADQVLARFNLSIEDTFREQEQ